MVDLNIRFQIAAMVIVIIVVIDFFKSPYLKMLSTRFFELMMLMTGFNLMFDMITVYTVNHQDTVPIWTNRLCHQFFIGSVVLVLYMYFQYMVIISHEQKRYNKCWHTLVAIPLAVSMIFVVFGDLYYVNTSHGAYSYGQMAYVVYISAFLYLLGIGYISFDKKNNLTAMQRTSIRMALLIWIAALVVQIIRPYILLSGLGSACLLLIIYISFENQKTLMDYEVGGFNRSTFHRMFSEYYEQDTPLTILNIVFENYTIISNSIGLSKSNEAMQYVGNKIQEVCPYPRYHSRHNVFTIFLKNSMRTYEEQLESLQKLLSKIEYEDCSLQIHMDLLDVRKYTNNREEVYELIEFMAHKKYGVSCTLNYMDEELKQNKYRIDHIEELLQESIAKESFEVVYQPIFDTRSNQFTSAEALIRMKVDEELGFISPEEFIPLAETKGMIIAIGDIVMNKVAKFWKEANLEQYGIEYIEVNLSGIQATLKDIDKRLVTILERHEIEPNKINLEITETAIVENENSLKMNMTKLRKSGFSFSMDDFGTGYSNLSQMSQTYYDLIKIDKSLLWTAFGFKTEVDEEEQKKSLKLLENVIQMLHDIPAEIVAEGVETKEMVDFLIEHQVEHLQGYYYSKPIKEDDYLMFIK